MEIRLMPCIMRNDDVLGREGSGFLKTRMKYPNTSLIWKNSMKRFIVSSIPRPGEEF